MNKEELLKNYKKTNKLFKEYSKDTNNLDWGNYEVISEFMENIIIPDIEKLDEPEMKECEFKDAGMYTPILKCDNCKSLYTILANDYLESNCELDQPTEWTYCPNCGQKIKKEKEENE